MAKGKKNKKGKKAKKNKKLLFLPHCVPHKRESICSIDSNHLRQATVLRRGNSARSFPPQGMAMNADHVHSFTAPARRTKVRGSRVAIADPHHFAYAGRHS